MVMKNSKKKIINIIRLYIFLKQICIVLLDNRTYKNKNERRHKLKPIQIGENK